MKMDTGSTTELRGNRKGKKREGFSGGVKFLGSLLIFTRAGH